MAPSSGQGLGMTGGEQALRPFASWLLAGAHRASCEQQGLEEPYTFFTLIDGLMTDCRVCGVLAGGTGQLTGNHRFPPSTMGGTGNRTQITKSGSKHLYL